MQEIGRIERHGRQRVRPQAEATAFVTEIRTDGLPAHSVEPHQVVFQRHRVERSRDGIAVVRRALEVRPGLSAQDLENFPARFVRHRGAYKIPTQRIDRPLPRRPAELLAEVEPELSLIHPRRAVRGVARDHPQPRSSPRLILETRLRQPDGFVEAAEKAQWVRHEVESRTLMRDQPMAVDLELVPLCFAAEDRVIVEHETGRPGSRTPPEDQGRRQPADASANDDAIVRLARIDRVGGQALEHAVANLMRIRHHPQRISVGSGVVAYSPKAGPRVPFRDGLRQELRGSVRRQERTRGDQRRVQKVAARDRRIHSERVVDRMRGVGHDALRRLSASD